MDTASAPGDRRRAPPLWVALVTRLHYYIGIFIGPFLLVAALSGMAYALTPQLENWLYHDALTTPNQGKPQPLSYQIEAARQVAGADNPVAAVRPAPEPGMTTRVMFAGADYGPSEHRALFIDPITLDVRGDMTVYGTSGVLPLRTAIDQFHRSLLLGDIGRLYSELAASWLWVAALAGGLLWWRQRRARRQHRAQGQMVNSQRLRQRHATLGIVALIGLLFFSATGLTWSQWAGGNIAELRHLWGWGTPSVSTDLAASPDDKAAADPHAAHHAGGGVDMRHMPSTLAAEDFDRALDAARSAGIDGAKIEMVPPGAPMRAWTIREIGREWPTQVDQIALDPRTFAVTDRADFATFPLAAKLTRWGIDLHMGVLFGLVNQLVLIAFAASLVTLVCWGYAMGWKRRSARRSRARDAAPGQTMAAIYQRMGWRSRLGVLGVAIAFGYALPMMGASLMLFIAIDWLRWRASTRQGLVRAA